MKRGGHSVGAALLAVAVGLGLTAQGGFGVSSFEEELKCEEAVAHLDECCSSIDPADFDCHVRWDGCDPPEQKEIDVDESECIRELSCSQLRDRGVCDRAANVEGYSRVCP